MSQHEKCDPEIHFMTREEFLKDPGVAFDAARNGTGVIVTDADGNMRMKFSPCDRSDRCEMCGKAL